MLISATNNEIVKELHYSATYNSKDDLYTMQCPSGVYMVIITSNNCEEINHITEFGNGNVQESYALKPLSMKNFKIQGYDIEKSTPISGSEI